MKRQDLEYGALLSAKKFKQFSHKLSRNRILGRPDVKVRFTPELKNYPEAGLFTNNAVTGRLAGSRPANKGASRIKSES